MSFVSALARKRRRTSVESPSNDKGQISAPLNDYKRLKFTPSMMYANDEGMIYTTLATVTIKAVPISLKTLLVRLKIAITSIGWQRSKRKRWLRKLSGGMK